MKLYHFFSLVLIFMLLSTETLLAQKKNRWTDTLEYAAARGKKVVLCGDETYFTYADQQPFIKEGNKKIFFKDLFQQKLDQEPAIEGNANIVAEIIVNCKGDVGSLKLIKYGNTENPAELALINAINHTLSELPTFLPAKNEGRVVNYKIDKIKFKTANGKITFNY
ncbi:MAG: hypothetical protein IT238_11370 [Bacteroidia bacterium]|nr:hypothetical protein [Bacteroidia bacterium]MCZ2249458.1 hypothetical protein [Bacteroidia bacterium]